VGVKGLTYRILYSVVQCLCDSWMNCVTVCRRWKRRWRHCLQWICHFSGQRLQRRRSVTVAHVTAAVWTFK